MLWMSFTVQALLDNVSRPCFVRRELDPLIIADFFSFSLEAFTGRRPYLPVDRDFYSARRHRGHAR